MSIAAYVLFGFSPSSSGPALGEYFLDDVQVIWIAAGISVASIKVTSKAKLPIGDGPFLTAKETGGVTPEGTHNSTVLPAYVRPSAQVVAIGMNYEETRVMAQEAYNALFPIRDQIVNGTWWRSVTMTQEPFDLQLDDRGRCRVAFNFSVVKRLSPAMS